MDFLNATCWWEMGNNELSKSGLIWSSSQLVCQVISVYLEYSGSVMQCFAICDLPMAHVLSDCSVVL